MIIYITSEEKQSLLDDFAKRYEWELFTEVMEKGSLNSFITEKLQVITSIRYLIIERSCVKENEYQLRDLLDTIRTIWDSHIILLEEVLQDEAGEYQKVIYEDYITSLYKYQDNLTENLEYLLKGEKIPAENVYSGTWIGVMSSNSGAGATHVAMELAQFISNAGESVCYVEANESGDLGAMAEFYGFEQIEDNHYRKGNIDYWHQMIDPEKKFAVLDIGKYSATKMEMFNQCKIKILITDGKPYRMADALNVLRYVKDDNTRLWLNYLQKEEYEKVKETYLSEMMNPVGRIDWHKDLFQASDALYQEALLGYLNVTIKKQSRFSFVLNADSLKAKFKKSNTNDVSLDVMEYVAEEEVTIENSEHTIEEVDMSSDKSPDDEITQKDSQYDSPVRINSLAVDISEGNSSISENENIEEEEQDVSGEGMSSHMMAQTVLDELEDDNIFVAEPKHELSNNNRQKTKDTSKAVTTVLMLLLMITGTVLAGFGALYSMSFVKEDFAKFFFNNQGVHQEATELVDEDLNINPDIKISVLEVEGADGYEVSYSTDKEFLEERTVVVEVQTADKAVESLTAGKTYYVRVRAFKYNEDGIKVYGEYTEVQKIKT